MKKTEKSVVIADTVSEPKMNGITWNVNARLLVVTCPILTLCLFGVDDGQEIRVGINQK